MAGQRNGDLGTRFEPTSDWKLIESSRLKALSKTGARAGFALACLAKFQVDQTIGTRRNYHGIGGQVTITL